MHAQKVPPFPKLTINGFTEEEEKKIIKRAQKPSIVIDDLDAFFRKFKDEVHN